LLGDVGAVGGGGGGGDELSNNMALQQTGGRESMTFWVRGWRNGAQTAKGLATPLNEKVEVAKQVGFKHLWYSYSCSAASPWSCKGSPHDKHLSPMMGK
jgi:hypothetical protein